MHGKHGPADEAEALIYKLETWRPFADILGVYFTRQNMQQQALAACADSSNPSVSYWLRGERLPTIDILYKLGSCLGCDIQQQRNLLNAWLVTQQYRDLATYLRQAVEQGDEHAIEDAILLVKAILGNLR